MTSSWKLSFLLILGWIQVGCQQPTATDPDESVKTLITGKAWVSDPAFQDDDEFTVYFYSDGRAVFGGGHPGTWSYKSSTFTITGDRGTGVTVNPDLTATHFYFNYGGLLCHLKIVS